MNPQKEKIEIPSENISEKNGIKEFMGFLSREVSSILLFQKTSELREAEKHEQEIKDLLQMVDHIEAKKALRSILDAYEAANGMRKRNSISILTDITDILPVILITHPGVAPLIILEIIVSIITTLENLRFRFKVLSPKIKSAVQATASYTGEKTESISSVKNIEDWLDIGETILEMYGAGQIGAKLGLLLPPLEVLLDGKTRKRIYDIQKSLYLDALKISEVYHTRRLAEIEGRT